ncbi:thioesterase II family protein [Kitasatospora brasiliensis]|uniref:thioesterase II family protein n=1 Tax=Kitasatospora brasiliensis TaxID=3058040 RepID=UPI002930FD81|nr:alpha/beta fold hydrolase [Kitasatospora sp. K002]
MSFLAHQLIGEARRRQVRLWVDSTGELRFAGPAATLDERFVALLRAQAGPITAKIGQDAPDRWLKPLTEGDGDLLLYLIPAAGAGPGAYRAWTSAAPAGLRIEAVLTPGREERFGEAPFTDVAALADRIAEQILRHADRPFGIFGHSTGALVAREVTRRLSGSTSDQLALFVAGALPPHLVSGPSHEPTDDELLAHLNAWQGTPAELLADTEFLRTFLPTLRADLRLFASCHREVSPAERVDVPVTALGGLHDETAPEGHCEAWHPWAAGAFRTRMVEGGHFFPVTAAREVLDEVVRELGHRRAEPTRT